MSMSVMIGGSRALSEWNDRPSEGAHRVCATPSAPPTDDAENVYLLDTLPIASAVDPVPGPAPADAASATIERRRGATAVLRAVECAMALVIMALFTLVGAVGAAGADSNEATQDPAPFVWPPEDHLVGTAALVAAVSFGIGAAALAVRSVARLP